MRDFDEDRRYCEGCGKYVRYLLSIRASYCTECGGTVRLFSPADQARFQASLKPARSGRQGTWPAEVDDTNQYA